MNKIILRMLLANKKRVIFVCLSVAFCFFFIFTINMIFKGYKDLQLEGAYTYGGRWDFNLTVDSGYVDKALAQMEDFGYDVTLVGTEGNNWSAKLDEVPEDRIYGPWAEYLDYYYLDLTEIEPQNADVLRYQLAQGRWPENVDEIALPQGFEWGGLSVNRGEIAVGDTVTLNFGYRASSDSKYILRGQIVEILIVHGQLENVQLFHPVESRTFTVSGIVKYTDLTMGTYVLPGYIYPQDNIYLAENDIYSIHTFYYMLNGLSAKDLSEAVYAISNDDGFLATDVNRRLQSTLSMVNETDFMKSVNYGVVIVEGFIFLIGLCIVCVYIYQTMKNNREQIRMFYILGADKARISYIYCVQNTLIGVVGGAAGVALFALFATTLSTVFAANLQTKFFKPGFYMPDTVFMCVAVLLLLGTVLCLTLALTHREIALNIDTKKTQAHRQSHRNKKQTAPIVGLFDLARRNMRFVKSRRIALTAIITLILVVAAVGTPIMAAIYQIGYEAEGARSQSDFNIYDSWTEDNLNLNRRDEIRRQIIEMPYVNSVSMLIACNRSVHIAKDLLSDDAVYYIKKMEEEFGHPDGELSFDEAQDYRLYVDLVAVSEDNYKELVDLNPNLPPYEIFASGESCLLYQRVKAATYDEMAVVDNTQTPVGEEKIIDMTRFGIGDVITLDLYDYYVEDIAYPLKITSVIDDADRGFLTNFFGVALYIPEKLYLDHFVRGNTQVGYMIKGDKNNLEALGKDLDALCLKLEIFLSDRVTEANATRDTMTVQLVSVAAVLAIILGIGLISIYVVLKIDRISREPVFGVYRAMGLERRKAALLRFYEYLISIIDAAIISMALIVGGAVTGLSGLLEYYGVGGVTLAGYYAVAVLVVAVLALIGARRGVGRV